MADAAATRSDAVTLLRSIYETPGVRALLSPEQREEAEALLGGAPSDDGGIYEDEARSIISDAHAGRCLLLRRSLPRLEMPCVRAATSTPGAARIS